MAYRAEFNYYCLTAGDKRPQYRRVAAACNKLNGANRFHKEFEFEMQLNMAREAWMEIKLEPCPSCGSIRLRSVHSTRI